MPRQSSVRISSTAKVRVELKVRTSLDASRAEAFSRYTGKVRLAGTGGLRALLSCHCRSRNHDLDLPHAAAGSGSSSGSAAGAVPRVLMDAAASASSSALADNGCACEAKAASTLIQLALSLLDDSGSCLGLGLGGADADSIAALRAYATAGAVRLVLVAKRRRCGLAARSLALEDARVECIPFAGFCSAVHPSSQALAPLSAAAASSSPSSHVYRSASIEGPLPLVTSAAAHAHAWFTADGSHQDGGGTEWLCGGYPAFLAHAFFGPQPTAASQLK
jgi:hypothetical protein